MKIYVQHMRMDMFCLCRFYVKVCDFICNFVFFFYVIRSYFKQIRSYCIKKTHNSHIYFIYLHIYLHIIHMYLHITTYTISYILHIWYICIHMLHLCFAYVYICVLHMQIYVKHM